jgi:hypothetical protein
LEVSSWRMEISGREEFQTVQLGLRMKEPLRAELD